MKVLNKHHYQDGWPPNSIDITRASKNELGNPFRIGIDGDRREVIVKHMAYARKRIATDSSFREKIKNLRGKNLMCVCHPLPCHGDNYVILCQELNS